MNELTKAIGIYGLFQPNEAEKAKRHADDIQRDAEFMAHVWQLLKRNGWLDEVELEAGGGDIAGVDFVADRILSRSKVQS